MEFQLMFRTIKGWLYRPFSSLVQLSSLKKLVLFCTPHYKGDLNAISYKTIKWVNSGKRYVKLDRALCWKMKFSMAMDQRLPFSLQKHQEHFAHIIQNTSRNLI